MANVDKTRFDFGINSGRVVIENTFASLKNRWQILKHFNAIVDKAVRVAIACCVLHNYCKIWATIGIL